MFGMVDALDESDVDCSLNRRASALRFAFEVARCFCFCVTCAISCAANNGTTSSLRPEVAANERSDWGSIGHG